MGRRANKRVLRQALRRAHAANEEAKAEICKTLGRFPFENRRNMSKCRPFAVLSAQAERAEMDRLKRRCLEMEEDEAQKVEEPRGRHL